MMIWQAPPQPAPAANTQRPGWKWWAMVITAFVFPPFGLVCLAILGWRKWKGQR